MEYKGNSLKSKEAEKPEKKVEKVVKGKVITKKRSEARKFMDVFFAEDLSKVKDYILDEVLIPACKKALDDIVSNGIKTILWGESGRKPKKSGSTISYRSYYDDRDRDRDHSYVRASSRRTCDYDDIVLTSRSEAEDVLDGLNELIETYGNASVADLYELVGLDGDYTANRYGWKNIADAVPVRVRDGYMLKLPKAVVL